MRVTTFLSSLLLSASMSVAALADAGHDHSNPASTAYGEPGDPKKPARVINITMRETEDGKMLFAPNKIAVKRGEQIRFKVRNDGQMDHEIVVATRELNLKHAEHMRQFPEMEHDDPNAIRLTPKKSGDLVWRFTKAGEFDFSCLIPGHLESGMTGTITVK